MLAGKLPFRCSYIPQNIHVSPFSETKGLAMYGYYCVSDSKTLKKITDDLKLYLHNRQVHRSATAGIVDTQRFWHVSHRDDILTT